MPDTLWEKKAEIKEAMREVLINCGSPVTMANLHDRVQKSVGGNPSYTTIKNYLGDFEQNGLVQKQKFANGLVFWSPVDSKLKDFKKVDFEEKDGK